MVFFGLEGERDTVGGVVGGGESRDGTTKISSRGDAQFNLVLYVHDSTRVAAGVERVVVGAVAVNAQRHVRGVKHIAGKSAGPASGVVVHDDGEIAGTIVFERSVKVEGDPCTCGHSHGAGENLVAGRDSNPVSSACERLFVGSDHVHRVRTGFLGATVVKRNTGNGSSHTDFLGSVNLLGQTVVVKRIAGEIGACGSSLANYNCFLR